MIPELLFVSLVVLLLVLVVLLVLCWTLRHSRSRNLTELKISPGRILTIRTELDHAQQMLDHLLDRVFLQVETGPESREETGPKSREDTEEDLEEQSEGDSGSEPEISTAASFHSRVVNVFPNKLWKWITVSAPPAATPPPPPPPADQDQTDDLRTLTPGSSQYGSLFLQGASSSASLEDETQF